MYICVYVHIDIWLDKHNMVKQTTCTNKINNHTSHTGFYATSTHPRHHVIRANALLTKLSAICLGPDSKNAFGNLRRDDQNKRKSGESYATYPTCAQYT